MTPDEFAHAYPQTPHQQALNAAAPALQAAPAPTFGDRALGVAKGLASAPVALLNEGIGQTAAGLSGLGAALTGSKDFVDASNDISRETAGRTSAMEGGMPLGERGAEIGGSILPLLNPVTAPLVPLGMAGSGYVGATNEGATRGQALGKSAIMGGIGAALPGLGRVLAPAIAPVGDALAQAVSPLAGRVATGVLQGGAAGTALGAAEAGSTALYNPELASERFNDIPSSAGLLALLSGGHGAFGRSPIDPAAPVEPIGKPGMELSPEERLHFERKTDPFADVAADQTIRPGSDVLSPADEANLRMPEPKPAEPTPEQVALDSTPEADVAAAAKAKQDPLDAFDPEQIGEMARRDGGQETQADMSAVEANRRALADRLAADAPTEDLPPVEPEAVPPTEFDREPLMTGDHRDTLGESDANLEPVKAPQEIGIPSASVPDVTHLAPDAQEALAKMPPEIRDHPLVRETVESRRTANDAVGDKGNVEQAAEFARAAVVRAKRKAEKAAMQAPKVEPASVVSFTTAKGSTYTVDAEGRTQRTKSDHTKEGHDKGDVGLKAKSEKTYYMDPNEAGVLGGHQGLQGAEGHGLGVIVKGGRAYPVSWNKEAGRWGVSPDVAKGYALSDKPEVGKAPLELWKSKTGKPDMGQGDLYTNWHPGNKITEMRGAAERAPEAPKAPESVDVPTERDIRPVSGPEKLAPGDRVNSDPEHSLKSENPVARDAEKILAQDRVKPERRAQEPLREAAAERVRAQGPDVVAKRLVEKHHKGEAWTQDEDNEAQKTLEHFAQTEPTGTKIRELYEAMNAQNTAKGRGFANLRDRVQTPAARHAEANGLASTASAAKAKVLQHLLQEQAQDKAQHTRAKRNEPVSEAKAPSEKPAAKALKSANAKRKAELDAEFPKLLEEFKKSLRAPGTNALGGRPAEALYQLLENRVKAGTHSFVDLVRGLKKDVPDLASNQDVRESVEQGWERLRQDHPHMEEGGRVSSTLTGIDYAARAKSLEARMEARDKKIAAIRSGIEKDAEALQKFLGKRGYDLRNPDAEWLKDPNRFGDFLAHVDAFKGGIPSVVANGYIGALHASFGIPAVKAVTDIDALAGDAIVRTVEGLIRGITFRPNAGRELKAFWSTVPSAAAQAAKNTLASLWHERAVGPGSEHEVYGAPSPFTVKMGMAGTVLRQASMLPLVRAINSGATTYAAMTDAAAWAVRSAKGLKGKELEDHIQREIGDQNSDSWKHAIQHAQSLTQTTPLGITNYIARLKHSQDNHVAVRIAARVMAPFVTIPTNVALSALRRLPVTGDLAAVARLLDYKEGSVHLHPEKMTHEVARALLRWGLYGVASSYLFDDKSAFHISGYGPQGKDYKGDPVYKHAPHTLTTPWGSIDINRLGIAGKALAAMRDYHDGDLKEGIIEAGKEEALVRPFRDLWFANHFAEKSGGASWGAYAANRLPIPSFLGQIGRARTDVEHQSFDPEAQGSFWKGLASEVKARLGDDETPPLRYGGHDVKKAEASTAFRLLSPAQPAHTDEYYKAQGKKIVTPKHAN